MTIDLEDWYQSHDLKIGEDRWSNLEDRILYGTDLLLELFTRYKIQGTFFVLGCVAQKHPELIRKIASDGHEIGSHGYWHRMVCQQTRGAFREELLSSKKIIEDITGREVNMYRAPSWSISAESLWALDILEEEGFCCDSSIQPFRTPLSGITGAPTGPYHPIIGDRQLRLLEFPPTVLQLGRFRLPFSGGFYLRAFPKTVVAHALSLVNKKGPGMIYIHPWEMDSGQPRLPVSPIIWLTHYLNLGRTEKKLEYLFKYFNFMPLGHFLKQGVYPAIPVL